MACRAAIRTSSEMAIAVFSALKGCHIGNRRGRLLPFGVEFVARGGDRC